MRLGLMSLLSLFLLALPAPILANGNYSHLWVATDALNYLDEGELKELLTREALWDVLRNGAMFPDGGYAVGDGYGELAHWEPFQSAYLEWIRANYQPPWSDEAAQHIAFLMGMAAHGMTDQLYDGMYLERHEHFDPPANPEPLVGLDGATDGCFAASQGVVMAIPEFFVPAEELAPLFKTAGNHTVTPQTLTSGQNFVKVALIAANDAVNTAKTLEEYMAAYPWACSHQDDPAVPGSPVTAGQAVARYYEVLWARLHGEAMFAAPLLGTYFTGGTPFDQPTDSSNPDGWVSFVMPFGLNPATVNNETVNVTFDGGQTHPVSLKVYYGSDSHLVNIRPTTDWPADTEFTVTIAPPLASWDGHELETTHTFAFATFPDPDPDPIIEVVEVVEAVETAEAYEEILSEDLGRHEEVVTQDVAGDAVGTDLPAAADIAGTVEPDNKAGGGGGCNTRPGAGAFWPLLLLLVIFRGLRRYRRSSI